jgi:hypothetical protein
MINLLPQEVSQGYKFARINVVLRKWVISFFILLIGICLVGTYGLIIMQRSEANYQKQDTGIQNGLNKEDVTGTKNQVQAISNSLKLSVKVLSSEVLFSKLLTQIGAVMPNGAVLTGLTINEVQGGLELSADSTNYTTGTQVQVNLASPANKIFSRVDLESIQCLDNSTTGYGCQVQLRALFNTTNQFLFINQGGNS